MDETSEPTNRPTASTKGTPWTDWAVLQAIASCGPDGEDIVKAFALGQSIPTGETPNEESFEETFRGVLRFVLQAAAGVALGHPVLPAMIFRLITETTHAVLSEN